MPGTLAGVLWSSRMMSCTGRPRSPPLALTSSRQMSSAVLITLLGAAPAPVSARPMPILIGSPLWAAAFENESNPTINAAADARSAFPTSFVMASSLWGGASLRTALVVQSPTSFVHLVVRHDRHDAPVVRGVRVLGPDLRRLRPVAVPGPRFEIAHLLVHLVELRVQLGNQPVGRAMIREKVM